MSRHRSSPAEQLLGLLFLAVAGLAGLVAATGRFVWDLYTYTPEDGDNDSGN